MKPIKKIEKLAIKENEYGRIAQIIEKLNEVIDIANRVTKWLEIQERITKN